MLQSNQITARFAENYTTYIGESFTFFADSSTKNSQQIATLNAVIAGTSNNIQKGSRVKTFIQDFISSLALRIVKFQRTQKTLIQKLSIDIVAPERLVYEMEQVSVLLQQRNRHLPHHINNIHNNLLHTFYNFTTLRCTITNNQLVIEYSLPIVESGTFNFYQLTAFPRRLNETLYEMLLPDITSLAINHENEKYFVVYENELQKCYRTATNQLLCQTAEALTSTKNTDSCAVQMLSASPLSANCNYKIANITNELWIQLKNPNTWLFLFPTTQ